MTPTDITPPEDHEKPVHFIRTELAARAGVVATGASTTVTFIDTLSPYFKFAALVMTVLVGVPTFVYYTGLAIQKWRELLRSWREEE